MYQGYWKESKSKRALRAMHYKHQHHICAYCGEYMNNGNKRRNGKSVTLEHIIPQTEGGPDTVWNTIAVCYDCNFLRSSFPLQFHQMVGIFLAKGITGLYPIWVNLYKAYKQRFVNYFTPIVYAGCRLFG